MLAVWRLYRYRYHMYRIRMRIRMRMYSTRKDIAKSPSRVPEAFSSLIRLYNQYFSHQASCHDPRPALDDPVK